MNVRLLFPILLVGCLVVAPCAVFAQLRSPTYGWNLGNTLEAPGGEGAWAPKAKRALIDAVADAGFNTVRIPVACNSHANRATYEIDPDWLARIKEVVDWGEKTAAKRPEQSRSTQWTAGVQFTAS